MRLHIGAGDRDIDGFVNVEPRRRRGAKRGHAGDLSFAADGMVEVIYCNAVFEHFYLGQQHLVLREWDRVLAPDGVAIVTGIPDFETVARSYLDRAPGLLSDRFDLYHAYRFTHGIPEDVATVSWRRWNPMRQLNRAPAEWLPYVHKSLFDTAMLHGVLEPFKDRGTTVFRYSFPNEAIPVNLGFVLGPGGVAVLRSIPQIDSYAVLETVTAVDAPRDQEQLAAVARRLSEQEAPSFLRKFISRSRRAIPARVE